MHCFLVSLYISFVVFDVHLWGGGPWTYVLVCVLFACFSPLLGDCFLVFRLFSVVCVVLDVFLVFWSGAVSLDLCSWMCVL